MIPLRDSIPNVHRPVAVWLLLALNAAVFLFTLNFTPRGMSHLIHLFGVIPARYTHLSLGAVTGSVLWDLAPLVTYMFLHAGFLHFLINMWSLWIFADNVEDVMGPVRFLFFYLLCGLAALAVHVVFHPSSTVPVVGASGAVAGVMGAYFVLYPHGRVLALIPIFIFPWIVEIPAVIFLGIWFLIQFASGLMDAASVGDGSGIAFWAHAGGFAAGMLLIPVFRIRRRCYYCFNRVSRRYERER